MSINKQHKFRSGSELRVANDLEDRGIAYEYEHRKVIYQKKPSKYLIDFELPNGIIVEVKGRFVGSDRAKHLLVKAQHPDLDIRFVFDNPNRKLYTGSSNTYADWCEKHGFKYATKYVPKEWLDE